MAAWIDIAGLIILIILCIAEFAFIITSVLENRWLAVRMAGIITMTSVFIFGILFLSHYSGRYIIISIILGAGLLLTVFLILPWGRHDAMLIPGPQSRVDERDAIFHRFNRIKAGTPEFDSFYCDHPEKQPFDEAVRKLPEIGFPGSKSYHPFASLFQAATFDVIERLTRAIDWEPCPVSETPVKALPKAFTKRIKGFARYLGADAVGTTRLNPAYIYSHIGRSPGKWGASISLNHTYAIAICKEMDHRMIRHAPDVISSTETSRQYFEVGKIAMLVARYIHYLGYEARAHLDGNYRVLCVPIAVDAGLGELGRMGLLMTSQFGPRVRLSIVTTNLPLVQDRPISFGVQDFCSFCRKCAVNCPSGAIATKDKGLFNGVEKWQSDQEACYRFWRVNGSDCSVCVNVCPYSHPKSPVHDLVRWAIGRNQWARRLALLGDDFFYGRRPTMRYPKPDWHTS